MKKALEWLAREAKMAKFVKSLGPCANVLRGYLPGRSAFEDVKVVGEVY